MRIINLVGARPQFIKAAAISSVLRTRYGEEVEEIIIHSGQHYDDSLSSIFFKQLGLPIPKIHLNTPVSTEIVQTGFIMQALEKEFENLKPDALLLYGDTTTTLAGALVAAKLGIPIAHIEAGLRSYNLGMPEELNRVITDRLSSFLFVPTETGLTNLKKEGILHSSGKFKPGNPLVENVGDVMIDCLRVFGEKARLSSAVKAVIQDKPLILLTLHRNFNTAGVENINTVLMTMATFTNEFQVVFPIHPRTAKLLAGEEKPVGITYLEPLSYFDMLALEQRASIIVTDSGGIQKEAFFFKKPLVVLRPETEWKELVENGVAACCRIDEQELKLTIEKYKGFEYPDLPAFYGDGFASERICESLIENLA